MENGSLAGIPQVEFNPTLFWIGIVLIILVIGGMAISEWIKAQKRKRPPSNVGELHALRLRRMRGEN